MGLDMYLTREININEFYGVNANVELKDKDTGEPLPVGRMVGVIEEVKYWRKANAIHKWFVDNVQNGVDDCGLYEVPEEKMIEFFDLLVKANLEKNPEYLPPTEGFFFGSTAVDEWYWQDIIETIAVLKPYIDELKKPYQDRRADIKPTNFKYQSSW